MKLNSSWGLKRTYKVYLALQALGKPSTSREVSEKLKTMLDEKDEMITARRLDSNYVSGMLYTLVDEKRIKLVHRGGGRWNPSLFVCKEKLEDPIGRRGIVSLQNVILYRSKEGVEFRKTDKYWQEFSLCEFIKDMDNIKDLEGTYTYTIKFVCTDREFMVCTTHLEKQEETNE